MVTRKRPTLVDLATSLGVSRQTVSNVINRPEVVRPELRARIERAIQEQGYRPSHFARSLRTQRAMSIAFRLGAVTDGINGAVMDHFLHGATVAFQLRGYRVTLFSASDPESEIEALDDLFRGSAVDGAILTDTHTGDPRPAALTEAGMPFVAFGRPWDDLNATHAWVDVDGRAGTRAATRHLLDRGYERIGYIGWPDGSGVGDDRRSGWADAMGGRHGDLVARVEDGSGHGADAARELRERGAEAVVCASDSLALGALTQFSDLPDPGSRLVGFDNTPVAAALGLSSVGQPVVAVAQRMVDILLGLVANESGVDTQSLVEPSLVVRDLEPFVTAN